MVKRILLLFAILSFSCNCLYSDILVVDDYDNIQEAVNSAADGDTIMLHPGTYKGTGNNNIRIKNKSLTITTSSSAGNTIIDAEDQTNTRIFYIDQDDTDPNQAVHVTLEGLILTGTTYQAVLFQGDQALPQLTMQYCNINNNSSNYRSAGIAIRNTGKVEIIGCGIESNTAAIKGAGIYAENCLVLNVIKSVIRNNKCTASNSLGGGIYMINSNAYFYQSFIYGNSSGQDGGAAYIDSSYTEISFLDCAISGNSTSQTDKIYTGGIFTEDVTNAKFHNCVFYGNRNYGLECRSGGGTSAAEIKNSIFWANQTGQLLIDSSVDAEVTYCFIEDGYESGENIFTEDPDFKSYGSWTDNTWYDPYDSGSTPWHLNFTSPCIDSGDPDFLPLSPESEDINGDNRFLGKTIDPGIDEYSGSSVGKVYNLTTDTWYNSEFSITDALAAASPGDNIYITPGLYKEAIAIDPELEGITLSGFQPHNDAFKQATIIDGSDFNGPVIYLAGSEITSATTITGLSITGGTGLEDQFGSTTGGGIYCENASPTIGYCRIHNNSADIGGGIAISNAAPEIIACVIKENTAQTHGPGIAAINSSSPRIYNCALNKNISGTDGEIDTGALYFDYTSYPTDNTDTIIRNCLFRENKPYGLYYENIANLEINSSIFVDNDPNLPDESPQLYAPNENITLNYCNIVGWEGPGIANTESDISFKTEEPNEYIATVTADVNSYINSGDPDYIPADDELDIDGNDRVMNCRIDIGPFEQASTITLVQQTKNVVHYNSNIYCTIQEAIDAAEDNSSISLGRGTYKENIIINKKGIRLYGYLTTTPEDVSKIIIDGSLINIPDDLTDIEDPNDPNYQGAAITLAYGQADDTTLESITLIGGKGSLDINGKLNGGCISSQHNNNIKISNCILQNSSADNGGAVYISASDKVLLKENIIKNNTATENGGAVCLVSCDQSYIATCQITNNQADSGGAVHSEESKTSIDFCTIADNSAANGGAVYSESPTESTTISNSIIHNNTSPQLLSSDNDLPIEAKYSCITDGYIGDHIITDDPEFLDSSKDNYQLSAYSPCVNMAFPAPPDYPYSDSFDKSYYKYTLQDTGDTRDLTQSFNPNYDIGAYEVFNTLQTIKQSTNPVSLYEMVGQNKVPRGQFTTINDALEEAFDDFIIELEPGLYNEQITINRPGITIRGKLEPPSLAMRYTIIQSSKIDLEADDDENPVISISDKPAVYLTDWLANDTTLEGLTIVDGAGFEQNSSDDTYKAGGGICSFFNDNLSIKWCSIFHNTADAGGGIALVGCSNVNMEHCQIASNTANRSRGGAIWLQDCSSFNMNYCTISANTAKNDTEYTQTGGIFLDGSYADINIKNSIIYNNTPTNMNKLGVDDDQLTFTNCVLPNATGTDIISTDPLFAGPTTKDFHPKSPAGRYRPWYRDWIKDSAINSNKSPAIDAAKGTINEIELELFPAGDNTNIGIYGASPEASLSFKTVSDVEKADLNSDYIIDYYDLITLCENWLNSDCFSNLDREKDCNINMAEFTAIAANWQKSGKFELANINNDETVDISDFAILTDNWHNADYYTTADINKDGDVNLTDLQIVISQWLETNE